MEEKKLSPFSFKIGNIIYNFQEYDYNLIFVKNKLQPNISTENFFFLNGYLSGKDLWNIENDSFNSYEYNIKKYTTLFSCLYDFFNFIRQYYSLYPEMNEETYDPDNLFDIVPSNDDTFSLKFKFDENFKEKIINQVDKMLNDQVLGYVCFFSFLFLFERCKFTITHVMFDDGGILIQVYQNLMDFLGNYYDNLTQIINNTVNFLNQEYKETVSTVLKQPKILSTKVLNNIKIKIIYDDKKEKIENISPVRLLGSVISDDKIIQYFSDGNIVNKELTISTIIPKIQSTTQPSYIITLNEIRIYKENFEKFLNTNNNNYNNNNNIILYNDLGILYCFYIYQLNTISIDPTKWNLVFYNNKSTVFIKQLNNSFNKFINNNKNDNISIILWKLFSSSSSFSSFINSTIISPNNPFSSSFNIENLIKFSDEQKINLVLKNFGKKTFSSELFLKQIKENQDFHKSILIADNNILSENTLNNNINNNIITNPLYYFSNLTNSQYSKYNNCCNYFNFLWTKIIMKKLQSFTSIPLNNKENIKVSLNNTFSFIFKSVNLKGEVIKNFNQIAISSLINPGYNVEIFLPNKKIKTNEKEEKEEKEENKEIVFLPASSEITEINNLLIKVSDIYYYKFASTIGITLKDYNTYNDICFMLNKPVNKNNLKSGKDIKGGKDYLSTSFAKDLLFKTFGTNACNYIVVSTAGYPRKESEIILKLLPSAYLNTSFISHTRLVIKIRNEKSPNNFFLLIRDGVAAMTTLSAATCASGSVSYAYKSAMYTFGSSFMPDYEVKYPVSLKNGKSGLFPEPIDLPFLTFVFDKEEKEKRRSLLTFTPLPTLMNKLSGAKKKVDNDIYNVNIMYYKKQYYIQLLNLIYGYCGWNFEITELMINYQEGKGFTFFVIVKLSVGRQEDDTFENVVHHSYSNNLVEKKDDKRDKSEMNNAQKEIEKNINTYENELIQLKLINCENKSDPSYKIEKENLFKEVDNFRYNLDVIDKSVKETVTFAFKKCCESLGTIFKPHNLNYESFFKTVQNNN